MSRSVRFQAAIPSLGLLALPLVFLVACPDEPPTFFPPYVESEGNCTRGGVASWDDNTLVVLADSYDRDEPLCLEPSYDYLAPPDGFFPDDRSALAVTPFGTQLRSPVQLTLRHFTSGPLVVLRRDGPADSDWEVLRDPLFDSSGLATLRIERTGIYVVASEPGRPACEVTNRCGGCAVLEAEPGTACGPCGLDQVACLDANTVVCNGESTNSCGGCSFLPAEPGDTCGPCFADHYICDGENAVVCDGAVANACGGCGDFDLQVGDACGPCGLDTWQCGQDNNFVCSGSTEANACGGCMPLEGTPEEACGPCQDGAWACMDGGVVCEGATPGNACGGCGELDVELGTPCGECRDGRWGCSEEGEVICQGGSNVCGEEPVYVTIAPGSFEAGSSPEDPARSSFERDAATSRIERAFLLQTTEVTQRQWSSLMDGASFHHQGCPSCPAENINFMEALAYLNRLSERDSLAPCYSCVRSSDEAAVDCADLTSDAAGHRVDFDDACLGWRLPTEAEWGYAARAGASTAWSCGDLSSCLNRVAIFEGSSGGQTQPVGSLEANAWGLYDMTGNVWEWVWGSLEQPPAQGSYTWTLEERPLVRGGGFDSDAELCRVAALGPLQISGWAQRWRSWGLRAARTAPPQEGDE